MVRRAKCRSPQYLQNEQALSFGLKSEDQLTFACLPLPTQLPRYCHRYGLAVLKIFSNGGGERYEMARTVTCSALTVSCSAYQHGHQQLTFFFGGGVGDIYGSLIVNFLSTGGKLGTSLVCQTWSRGYCPAPSC